MPKCFLKLCLPRKFTKQELRGQVFVPRTTAKIYGDFAMARKLQEGVWIKPPDLLIGGKFDTVVVEMC